MTYRQFFRLDSAQLAIFPNAWILWRTVMGFSSLRVPCSHQGNPPFCFSNPIWHFQQRMISSLMNFYPSFQPEIKWINIVIQMIFIQNADINLLSSDKTTLLHQNCMICSDNAYRSIIPSLSSNPLLMGNSLFIIYRYI